MNRVERGKAKAAGVRILRKRRKMVCGYRLDGLSVRHMLGLVLIDSPVLSGYGDFADTLLAARILSTRTEEQWKAAVYGGGFLWKFKLFIVSAWYGRGKFWEHSQALKLWMNQELDLLCDCLGKIDGKTFASDLKAIADEMHGRGNQ